MNEQVLQALGNLRQMWASGQIEGQPLPQEAIANRMALPPEQFIEIVKQSEELQRLFSQMMGTPPAMAGTYQAQNNLPFQVTPAVAPAPGLPQAPNPFQGGSWGEVNRQLQNQPAAPGPFTQPPPQQQGIGPGPF